MRHSLPVLYRCSVECLAALLALPPAVEHLGLRRRLGRLRLRLWIVLVEPARGVVVLLETDRALAFRALLRATMRQLLLPGHGRSLAAPSPVS